MRYDPDRMTDGQRSAVAAWLRSCGEARHVALSPVRRFGPVATYRVYLVGDDGAVATRGGNVIVRMAMRWVGLTRPMEG